MADLDTRIFTLSATFKNVANLRVEYQKAPAFTGLERIPRALMDYGGFPLPGWEFFVNVAWSFDDPERSKPGNTGNNIRRSKTHARP